MPSNTLVGLNLKNSSLTRSAAEADAEQVNRETRLSAPQITSVIRSASPKSDHHCSSRLTPPDSPPVISRLLKKNRTVWMRGSSPEKPPS